MKTNGNFSLRSASTQYEKMMREFRASADVSMFGRVLTSVTGQPSPNVSARFAEFIQTAQTFKVSREVLSRFKAHLGGHITFWRAMGVVMIARRKRVHLFMAEDDLLHMVRDRSILDDEVFKTRFGYVPSSEGRLFNAGLHSQMNTRHKDVPRGVIRN